MLHSALDRLAYDRLGPDGDTPIVLIHAGIADRRMWDSVWPGLTSARDVVRIDLRGYGESFTAPEGAWSQRSEVRATLEDLDISRAHFIGCSYGAGVCVELALEFPTLTASLLLAAPAGSLLTQRTDDFARFLEAERSALDAGDIDRATDANVVHWVDGPHRDSDVVAPDVREAVRRMQRRAFEITLAWPDTVWEAEHELDPEPAERLAELTAPTLVLCGGLDLDTVLGTADLLGGRLASVRRVEWSDVAHLPSMERPDDFVNLGLEWIAGI